MEVLELKQSEISGLPLEISRLIPNYCMYCGNPLVINETLTGLSCSDEFCYAKVARRCVAFLKQLGYLGLGESQMRRFCQEYGIQSPVSLFMMEQSDLETQDHTSSYYKKLSKLVDFLQTKNTMPMSTYLTLAQMPAIQDATSEPITAPYETLQDMFDDLNYDGVDKIQNILGISTEYSLRSIKINEQLMMNQQVLMEPVNQGFVHLTKPATDLETLILVISDSAGPEWGKKKDFMDYIVMKFGDKFNIEFKGSLTKKTDILISVPDAFTSKVRKATDYGIPIMDGTKLVQALTNSSTVDQVKQSETN